jgi:methyltransferase (TIGR00027 family)
MGRAAGHALRETPRFEDPTALALLPDDARKRVERVLSRQKSLRIAERIERAYVLRQSQLMVARTVCIDDAVREAGHSQVVILGAGLDGRAWRMPELQASVVFEVDHPDTQREKKARTTSLKVHAAEVRFVPVDFTKDKLEEALASAGHDPTRPTTWI